MEPCLIDPVSGTVHLTAGLQIRRGMLTEDLPRVRLLKHAEGDLSWYTWSKKGRLSGMAIHILPEGFWSAAPKDAEFYKALEMPVKQIHDRILTRCLGNAHESKPHRAGWLHSIFRPKQYGHLKDRETLTWKFAWGTVRSDFEPRDHEPRIVVFWN